MMDFYKETCTGDIWLALARPYDDYDPMIGEAMAACAEAMQRPLPFSPPGGPPVTEFVPTGWDKLQELNEEAAALGLGNVIHFGPGVQ